VTARTLTKRQVPWKPCNQTLTAAFGAQVSREGEDTDLVARGRHDPCVVPRAVPMVEAMVALVLADQLLQARRPPTASGPLIVSPAPLIIVCTRAPQSRPWSCWWLAWLHYACPVI